MMTLSEFIAPESALWNSCLAWTTNSTVYELLTRIIMFGSDVHTVNEMHAHSPERAMEIANSKNSLSTLIGGNVALMANEPINGSLFLHQQQTLIPRWRRVAQTFQKMNYGLKEWKYDPDRQDPYYRALDPSYRENPAKTIQTAGEVLELGAYQMEKRFMALPTLAILFPIFRYVPGTGIHD